MSLKWLLVRRVALVATASLAIGALLVGYQSAVRAKRQNIELVDAVGREMERLFSAYARAGDIPEMFPDWDLITTPLLQSGQCAELRAQGGNTRHLNCAGLDRAAVSAPAWFVWLYAHLAQDSTAKRALSYRGTAHGSVVARYEPVAAASLAWANIAPLLGFSAALVGVLWLVIFFVIERALRPMKQIEHGLGRIARGDLAFRLPPFRLREFNHVGEGFNLMLGELVNANAERSALARRLVDAQEKERRHIAREIHDEIAQKLSGLNAAAAVLRIKAEREAGGLALAAKELERDIADLMLTVRRTLTYLRPQEIDDLGLVPSLRALVAQHNESAGGGTRFTLDTQGALADLSAETNAHVYRIVQEALTNAAKHADARHVQVCLQRMPRQLGEQETMCLRIIDDGIGSGVSGSADGAPRATVGGGAGLIGIRERVDALGGTLAAGPNAEGGFVLEVSFNTSPQGET